jgi:hypothetical protein
VQASQAEDTILNYSISQAFAYGYRLSVTADAIEVSQSPESGCKTYAQSDPPYPSTSTATTTKYGCKEGTQSYDDPRTTGPDPYKDYIAENRSLYQHYANSPTKPPSKLPCIPPPGNSPWMGQNVDAAAKDPTAPASGFIDTISNGSATPPLANPVKVNELYTYAHLQHSGEDLFGAGGRASDTWVDNAGRYNPDAHTESDPYSVTFSGIRPYEERCFSGATTNPSDPNDKSQLKPNTDPNNFVHVISRSKPDSPDPDNPEPPNTFHLAECKAVNGSGCSGSGSTGGRPSADKVRTSVHLWEAGGKVYGVLGASIGNLKAADTSSGHFLAADSVVTYVSFETDGTPTGLKWKAYTKVTGANLDGNPVDLPQGTFQNPPNTAFYMGVATPVIKAGDNGTSLTIVAPGLFYGTNDTQLQDSSGHSVPNPLTCPIPSITVTPAPTAPTAPTAPDPSQCSTATLTGQVTYYGGAELYAASIGRVKALPGFGGFESTTNTVPDIYDTSITAPSSFPSLGNPSFSIPISAPSGPFAAVQGPKLDYAVREVGASPWPAASILGLAFLGALAMLSNWLKRYEWVKRLFRFQPFATFDWMYRAFVRT